MLVGVVDKPEITMYWSTRPSVETPFFSKHMCRNRLYQIMMMFHLNDNHNNLPSHDPLHVKKFKIKPLIDHLASHFQEVCVPEENIAVDESMIPWRERVGFRQFLPSKPIRYGMKLYLCCESK